MHIEDPHGARGSTEHHALDYKGSVKKFNSADIMAAFNAASVGDQARGATVKAIGEDPSSSAVAATSVAAGPQGDAAGAKGAIKSFNSADLQRNMAGSSTGEDLMNGGSGGGSAEPNGVSGSGAVGSAAVRGDGEGQVKIRSWTTDAPEPVEGSGWTVDRLKDALAETESRPKNDAPKPAAVSVSASAPTPAAPPMNLMDLDDAPPASTAAPIKYANDPFFAAAFDSTPPATTLASMAAPGATPITAMPMPTPGLPGAAAAMPPPSMAPPSMAAPTMPSPATQSPSIQSPSMQSPSMPPPSMPPPSMPPPAQPPPAAASMTPPLQPPPSTPAPSMPPPRAPPPNASMPPPSMPPPSMPPPSMPPPSMSPANAPLPLRPQ